MYIHMYTECNLFGIISLIKQLMAHKKVLPIAHLYKMAAKNEETKNYTQF